MTCETQTPRRPRSGFLPDRTVHLHPLRRCNLACSHCYSASSPQAKGILPMSILGPALVALKEQGYEVLSLSGGEPMLYPDLADLLEQARSLGFRIVGISNGFRVNAQFAELVAGFDGMAISFDGMEEVHNKVRLNGRAWDMALRALEYLKTAGIPSAAAYTVSRESIMDVPDFISTVKPLGVRAVQLRPLVMAGRAETDYTDPALSTADVNRLWLMGQALSSGYSGELAIHTDLAHSHAIAADKDAWNGALTGTGALLSDRINPLVVTPEGALRPYTFDFPRSYDIGTLSDLIRSPTKVIGRTAPIADLLRSALHYAEGTEQFLDWFAFCRDHGRHMVA